MLSHANLIDPRRWARSSTDGPVEAGARYLHAAPMFHLADLAAWIGRNIVGGSPTSSSRRSTPAAVREAIEEHQVTDALLVPTMIQMLVDPPDIGDADLSQPARIALRRLADHARPCSSGPRRPSRTRPFTQAYGMTELAPSPPC